MMLLIGENDISGARSAHSIAAHLTKQQVRHLWDAGSFLIQEYGVLLNTRISLVHDRLRLRDVDADEFVSALIQQIGMRLKYWNPHAKFHWLYVRENTVSRGMITTMIMHIPDRLIGDIEHWLFHHFVGKRLSGSKRKAAVRFTNFSWRHQHPSAIRRHLQLMQMICRSVDPTIRVRHHGDRCALVDVLAVRHRSKEVFVSVEGRRLQVSQSLNRSTQCRARRENMPALSAFGDKAFAYLLTGWERLEFEDRQRSRADLDEELAKIDIDWPKGVDDHLDRVRQIAITGVVAKWSNAKQRLRSWEGWWLAPPSVQSGPSSKQIPLQLSTIMEHS